MYWVGPELAVRAAAQLADEYARGTPETRDGVPTATRIATRWSDVWETRVPGSWALVACPHIDHPIGVIDVTDEVYAELYAQPEPVEP